MESCKICSKQFKSIKSLSQHIGRMHNISTEDYYTTYIGSSGICQCGKPTKFRNMVLGYSKHCSSKCAYHDVDVTKKREDTTMDRYGVTKGGESPIIREKIKKTLISRYGVEHSFQSDVVRQKSIDTIMSRYGVDNVLKLQSTRDKVKQTNLDRYGSEHAMQSDIIRQKSVDTCMKNHGVMYPAQLDSIRTKQKETSIQKYGVDIPSKSDEIKNKIANTNLQRYGYTTPLKNPDVISKSVSTCMHKYGVTHPGNIEDAHNKKRATCKTKYGVEYGFQSDEIKQKIKSRIMELYSVEYITQSQEIKDKIANTNMELYGHKTVLQTPYVQETRHRNNIDRMVNKYINSLSKFNCELIDTRIDMDARVTYKCHNCGAVNDESWQFFVICRLNTGHTPCVECLPKRPTTSFIETDFYEFVKSISPNCIQGDRSVIYPQELDSYIPDKKIAFEFNGLHYHSELYKEPNYHLSKTVKCDEVGIHLIHIYEDDWLYKNDIVKSRIRNLLGISNKLYARKCIIKEVDTKVSNAFLELNHIQGKCRSDRKIGLYYNNELVSLMTFGKSRFADEYELIRFCNKLDTTVVGGASKLFNHFINTNTINEIISYADRSWSKGGLYTSIGFDYVGTTQPNYYYVVGDVRENRMKYQKHKLVEAGFDATKTEHQIMTDRKIYRIYDSGNLKYKWIRK